jgi:hemoglobin-like flavoprotein
MLTKREIEIVQSDWRKVELIAEVAGTLLYDRLFALDPTVQELFKTDMAEQKLKLLRMIGASVYGLSNPDVLLPIVEFLGRKHLRFGVRDDHYETVGEALLWTLKQGLGADFTAESEAAWIKLYGLLADTMKSSARGGGSPTSAPSARPLDC